MMHLKRLGVRYWQRAFVEREGVLQGRGDERLD